MNVAASAAAAKNLQPRPKPATEKQQQQESKRELEQLKQQLQELQRSCQDKDEQLKAVSNNRTILHSAPGYYFNVHNNTLQNDWPVELYTSRLKLSSVMQGGEEDLEDVLTAISKKDPAAMFVVTAPARNGAGG